MSRQVTIEVWTDDEAREEIYRLFTQSLNELSFITPYVSLEDVSFEIDSILLESFECALHHAAQTPLEACVGIMSDVALAQAAFVEVLDEIREAFEELYPAPPLTQAP